MKPSMRGALAAMLVAMSAGWFHPGVGLAAEPVKLVVGYQPYDTISYSAVVIRALGLWKKHLPPGSDVEFQNALQGSIIVNQMLANKQQIGYLGDMPAVVATTKRSVAPINLVANTGLSPGQRCNVIMVRADAPKFASPEEAVKWLDGKTVATPQGSCAHRFLGLIIEKTKIKPAAILNQSIEVIATNLRSGKIDGAVLWEPSVSRIGDIVGEGVGEDRRHRLHLRHFRRRGHRDARGLHESAARYRRGVAQDGVGSAAVRRSTRRIGPRWRSSSRTRPQGITVPMAWFSIYGAIPPAAGGSPIRDEKPFVFDDRVQQAAR